MSFGEEAKVEVVEPVQITTTSTVEPEQTVVPVTEVVENATTIQEEGKEEQVNTMEES